MEPIQLKFVEETEELLGTLSESLLALERVGGIGEPIHTAFRAAHSLKGGARLAGFPEVEALAQALEECLGRLRDGSASFSGPLCDLLLQGVDEMRGRLDPEAPPAPMPERLIGALSAGREADPGAAPEEGEDHWFEEEVPGLDAATRGTLNDEQELHIRREVKAGARLVGARCLAPRSEFPGALQAIERALATLGRLVGCVSRPPDGDRLVFLFLLLTRETDAAIRAAIGESECELSTLTRTAPAAPPPSSDLPPEALQGIFVEGIGELIEEFSRRLLHLEERPEDPDRVNALFRVGHNLKGVGGSLGFPVLSRLGHEMEAVLDRVRHGKLRATGELIDTLLAALDSLREIFRTVETGAPLPHDDPPVIGQLRRLYEGETLPPPNERQAAPPPKASVPSSPAMAEGSIRVGLGKIDRLINLVSELQIYHRGSDLDASEIDQVARWVADARRDLVSGRPERVGELLQWIAERLDNLQERQDERLLRTELLLGSLRDETLRVRMLPVGALFSNFHRLVRDVARPLGKEVELKLSGAETEIDKRILEGLADPMMHLLRNAVDHGVETPEERRTSGKPARATIDVQASQEGGHVVIRVRDDGRGLDLARLMARAVEMGHLTEEASHRLSPAQAADLVFIPGLSTRKEVTEISGRGVGMDVVRANVEKLKGSVTASSEPGGGTTFTLTLPLTLALLQALLVRVGSVNYCLPTSQVVEGILVESSGMRMLAGVTVIDHRERTFPVLTLSGLIGMEGAMPKGGLLPAIVVESGGQSAVVLVDELLAEQGVVIKGLGGLLTEVPGVAGATILGDGSVALILDLPWLLREGRQRGLALRALEPSVPGRRARRVLIADDTLTARELLRTVLESVGYEVVAAADGRQALDELRRDARVDLVITDLMMPNLDGLGLTRAIREDPARHRLPVVMVTSLGSDEERRQGLEAGASAYLTKRDFDRGRFLEVVENLLGAPA